MGNANRRTATNTGRPGSRMGRRAGPIVLLLVGIGASGAHASQISIPFFFVDGTVASAAEVNANFSVLVNESNAQDLRIGAIEERLHLELVSSEGEADPGDTDNAYLMVALTKRPAPTAAASPWTTSS